MENRKRLYIFSTSDRPDVYINVIRHCIDHFLIDREIVLIGIFKDRGKADAINLKLQNTIDSVRTQLRNLAQGKYNVEPGLTKEVEVADFERQKYQLALELYVLIPKAILYPNLGIELESMMVQDCIFDVSGLDRDYMVDIYSIVGSNEKNGLFYFKLIGSRKRTYDDFELIHNLECNADYLFENIFEGEFAKRTLMIPKTGELIMCQDQYDRLVNHLVSNRIWRWRFLINLLLAVPSILLLVYLFIHRWQWNELEPLTFIGLGPISLGILKLFLRGFFGKDRDILSIERFENWIRKRIKQRLFNISKKPD